MGWIAVGLALAAGSAPARPTQDDLAFFTAKTQEFSDAGLRGDRAVLDRDLAPDAAFTNEDGSTPTKAEILAGAQPPPASVQKSIKATDVKVRRSGPIAVVTFVDELTQRAFGQTVVYRYRSTEVWRKDAPGWRIIASQTLTLASDPPASALPRETLAEYAGAYSPAPGVTVQVAPTADGLGFSVGGGAPVVFRPELKDIFFLPGQPAIRRIFQRDAEGRITGYVTRMGGQDIRAGRV